VIIVEQRPPVKPMLPPIPAKPPYPYQPYRPPIQQPYHHPIQQPYHPPMQQPQFGMPCDPKMLHHMYRHMKMCHRYETHMLKWYLKWCKEQWKHRRQHQNYKPYESSSHCRRESSSHHHESQFEC
jgi:hypothetical protein